MHILDEDRADGVDGLVPVEAFADETVRRLLHGIFVAKGDLILDDDMDHGVQTRLRRARLHPSMIVRYESEALIFAEREPLLRVWRLQRVVAFHCETLHLDCQ